MKRIAVLMLLATIMIAATAFTQTVDELVEKNIEARGGREALEAIKTMKTFGKYSMMGMDFPFTTFHKRPSHYRMQSSFQGMTMVQAFDGTTAWTINPFAGDTEPREMSKLEALSVETEADINGLLDGYKDRGWELKYIGKEDMEGTPVYRLNLKMSDTMNVDIFLDAEYYIDVKMTANVSLEGKEIAVDTYLGDYKEVSGVMIPFSIETRTGGQQGGTVVIDSVLVNVDIPDSLFVMPAATEKEPAKEGGE